MRDPEPLFYYTTVKYLLNIIDVFSKYAWSVPLKDKTEIFEDVVIKSRKMKLNMLRVDQGNESYNRAFNKWLEDIQ